MLLDITPAQALEMVDSPTQMLKDRLVPAQMPHCPDSPYQPEYNWLFTYERRIAAFLEQWLKPYRYELIGEKGLLCEALSNAFCHGHAKDPLKPIIVRVLVGKRGIIIQIKDNGSGFDVRTVYHRYHKKKKYYVTAGNGIRRMAQSSNFGFFHDPTGTISHLVYFFKEPFENAVFSQKTIRTE